MKQTELDNEVDREIFKAIDKELDEHLIRQPAKILQYDSIAEAYSYKGKFNNLPHEIQQQILTKRFYAMRRAIFLMQEQRKLEVKKFLSLQ